ncbi:unnamed protein product, partial [Meganyctiphanes norvegica]
RRTSVVTDTNDANNPTTSANQTTTISANPTAANPSTVNPTTVTTTVTTTIPQDPCIPAGQTIQFPCDAGWTRVCSDCLQVFEAPHPYDAAKSREDADQHCKGIGGELAIPSRGFSPDWARHLQTDLGISDESFWIGGSYSISNGKYELRPGSPVPAGWWRPNEPAGPKDGTFCILAYVTNNSVRLLTNLCTTKYAFICE